MEKPSKKLWRSERVLWRDFSKPSLLLLRGKHSHMVHICQFHPVISPKMQCVHKRNNPHTTRRLYNRYALELQVISGSRRTLRKIVTITRDKHLQAKGTPYRMQRVNVSLYVPQIH